ncbi:two component transcriptional regulator, LuxR family [Dyadobacter koreensis]|uniref:Two component transcriptional regulator, LuxR family n=1 Tax=Dyadobacter koreensis TaxID=408657 RepID=A0A1H6PZM4_9BACT|nr:response regulator transcription factor [Dyadobacter koreensis]SEI37079.1 two component transcriptional regulator, LuxR family [Dyadobacter koreensis]
MTTLKLAVVDDHKLFRQGLIQILKKFDNYEVIFEAASGEELLEKVGFTPPDIVLLDLNMKGMSGQEASVILRTEHPAMKIIILSMNYSHDYIRQMMKIGVHGYLPKDIDQKKLVEAIDQVYSKGHYMDDEIAAVLREALQITERRNAKKSTVIESENIVLTEREMEVLKLICKGYNTGQIAEELFISYRTVEGHRKNLLLKTGVANSVSLVVFAVKHSLIDM